MYILVFPSRRLKRPRPIIIIIITPYPTSLYFHFTHSRHIGLLHRSSFASPGLISGCSFILQASFPVDSPIKFTHIFLFHHKFTSPHDATFSHSRPHACILPQILVYGIIKQAPDRHPSHDDLEPKRATVHGLMSSRLLLGTFKSGKISNHGSSLASPPVLSLRQETSPFG